MTTQSEQALESGLIKTLVSMNYRAVKIKDEESLINNFRQQFDIHNKIKALKDSVSCQQVNSFQSNSIKRKSDVF